MLCSGSEPQSQQKANRSEAPSRLAARCDSNVSTLNLQNLDLYFQLSRLDRYWSDQPLLYDFKAELAGNGDWSKCDIEV